MLCNPLDSTRRVGNLLVVIKVHDHVLPTLDGVKLLGVYIDSELKFDKHIESLCIKAGRQLNVLKRIGKNLNFTTKLLIYLAFVACHFNYCPLVWFFCSRKSMQNMEKIQYRALKFIFNDHTSSYESLLKRAGVNNLSLQRLKLLAIEVFKCYNKLNPMYLCDLFTPQINNYSLRGTNKLVQHPYKTVTYGRNSFKFLGSHIWNNLPSDLRCMDYNTFKSSLKAWQGCSCACNFCKYQVDL